jgi:hypothetical protein
MSDSCDGRSHCIVANNCYVRARISDNPISASNNPFEIANTSMRELLVHINKRTKYH